MLVIAIKDLEIQLNNLNLLIGKNVIWFELLVQKTKIDEQIAGAIYFFYLFTNNFISMYTCLKKTWAKTPLPRQNLIIAILNKQVLKKVIWGAEEKFEIIAVFNKYKNTHNNLIDSLDIEFLEVLRSKCVVIIARLNLERNHLNKDMKDQKGEKDCGGDKKRWIIREDSSPEISIYF